MIIIFYQLKENVKMSNILDPLVTINHIIFKNFNKSSNLSIA